MRRAAHQMFDTPLVLDDPFAVRIVGRDAAEALRSSPGGHQDRFSKAARAFMVARSRIAEDALGDAIGRGARQHVILGAGLDTFAYRNPFPATALHVFEVDYAATQAWKRDSLAAAGILPPPSVTFAPVDFERQTLAEGLGEAGFDRRAPTFFSWLGVTMYLSEEAIQSTLAFVGSTPAGGGLAFDYAVPRASLPFMERFVFDALARRVAAAGEPFVTFFDPTTLCARLEATGFHAVQDLDRDRINARYFTGRSDGLAIGGHLARVVTAEAGSS